MCCELIGEKLWHCISFPGCGSCEKLANYQIWLIIAYVYRNRLQDGFISISICTGDLLQLAGKQLTNRLLNLSTSAYSWVVLLHDFVTGPKILCDYLQFCMNDTWTYIYVFLFNMNIIEIWKFPLISFHVFPDLKIQCFMRGRGEGASSLWQKADTFGRGDGYKQIISMCPTVLSATE